MNLAIGATHIENASKAIAVRTAIVDSDASDQGLVMVMFVRALAKRQARLDVGLAFETTGVEPRTLH